MSFLRRRSATPAGPDFDVLAMDPGDWPGNLGAGLLPAPDGTCQGVFLRYDLFGGRGPAMIIGNLPEGSPARDVPEGEVPFEVGQLLLALENDEEVTVVSTSNGAQVSVDVSGLAKPDGFYEVWLLDKDAKKLTVLKSLLIIALPAVAVSAPPRMPKAS